MVTSGQLFMAVCKVFMCDVTVAVEETKPRTKLFCLAMWPIFGNKTPDYWFYWFRELEGYMK